MKTFSHSLLSAFRAHRNLWVLGLLYIGGFFVWAFASHAPMDEFWLVLGRLFTETGRFQDAAGTCLAFFITFKASETLHKRRHSLKDDFKWLRNTDAKILLSPLKKYFQGTAFGDAVSLFFFLLVILIFIGPYKSLFPQLGDFTWDPALAKLDAFLHFGRQPYEIIMPLVDRFNGADAIVWSYSLWFNILYGTCFCAAFLDPNRARAAQFCWSFAWMWIVLGIFMAAAFLSVGPLYYHAFYPKLPDIFKPLTDVLYSAPESPAGRFYADRLRLMEFVRDARVLAPNSISSMPSLHVASAWLFVLYWCSVSRWFIVPSALFFTLCFAGSVYLGWHYAIDGYAGVAGVTLIWWLVKKFKTEA